MYGLMNDGFFDFERFMRVPVALVLVVDLMQ